MEIPLFSVGQPESEQSSEVGGCINVIIKRKKELNWQPFPASGMEMDLESQDNEGAMAMFPFSGELS